MLISIYCFGFFLLFFLSSFYGYCCPYCWSPSMMAASSAPIWPSPGAAPPAAAAMSDWDPLSRSVLVVFEKGGGRKGEKSVLAVD